MKNPGISVLISLDSGLGREYGVEMIKESKYFDYEKVIIPYLHVTGQAKEQYNVERSTEFYDSISSSSKYSLLIKPFAHHHFASEIGFIPQLLSDREDREITKTYRALCDLTLAFCNAFLKLF